MKTAELEGKILDYYVALAVGHVWRYQKHFQEGWMPTYTEWQQSEDAHGNPTPPYSSDWAACGPLIERFDLSIIPDRLKCWDCMYFNNTGNLMQASSKAPQEAICRAVVALHFGQDVPDVKL